VDAIRYVRRNVQVCALSRRQGDKEMSCVSSSSSAAGPGGWGLTVVGSDTVMLLGAFSRKAVRQACLARGWRFDDRAIVRR
jgi:hypothetical protein